MQLFVVDLDEGALYYDVSFGLPVLDFFKDQLDHTRDDAQVLLLDGDGVATAHCECFSWTCLTIGEHCSIEPLEAAEDEIPDTGFKDFMLLGAYIEYFVEVKRSVLPDHQLVFFFIALSANGGWLK